MENQNPQGQPPSPNPHPSSFQQQQYWPQNYPYLQDPFFPYQFTQDFIPGPYHPGYVLYQDQPVRQQTPYQQPTPYPPVQLNQMHQQIYEAQVRWSQNAMAMENPQRSHYHDDPSRETQRQESQSLDPQPSSSLNPTAKVFLPASENNPASTFEDPIVKEPKDFLAQQDVADAISILRLNLDIIYEFRRKYHGNNVPISSLPFKPLSRKSSYMTVEGVVTGLLEAVLRAAESRGATSGPRLIDYLDMVGIPESHQSFMQKFLLMRDLKYWSLLILLSVYFDLAPLSTAQV